MVECNNHHKKGFTVKQLFTVLSFILAAMCSMANHAHANETIETAAKQAIIIDYDTGTVLFEKNADQKMPTSSMSKVMTMYLIFDALQRGDLSLNDEFLVSEKAWKKGGSKMFVPVGKKIKIEDLIRGVIIQSGNDATIVLAEGLAGSEDAFAEALNNKARELGMKDSHFMNASGWPDPDHYSTARDLATMAKAIIENFPDYYGYYAEKSFTYSKIKQANRNPLLNLDIGADGIKTGHTDDGGYGLIASGINKDNRRVVMVLNGMASKKERKTESARLLQWALNGFKTVTLFDNEKSLGEAAVYLGVNTKVPLVAEKAVNFVVPKIFVRDLKVELYYNAPLKAPITKGQEIGTVKVHIPKGEVIEVPLVAARNVAGIGFFPRLIKKARLLTTGQGKFN